MVPGDALRVVVIVLVATRGRTARSRTRKSSALKNPIYVRDTPVETTSYEDLHRLEEERTRSDQQLLRKGMKDVHWAHMDAGAALSGAMSTEARTTRPAKLFMAEVKTVAD